MMKDCFIILVIKNLSPRSEMTDFVELIKRLLAEPV